MEEIKIKALILEYLSAKGMIKACLLHKLINFFCSSNSKYTINKSELFSCLLSLVKERKLDIIIVNTLDIYWKISTLKNSTYLNDGEYFRRTFHAWNYSKLDVSSRNEYIFDTRKIDLQNPLDMKESFEWLLEIFKKKKKVKYKTIIFLAQNSNKLIIFEPLDASYKLSINEINPPINVKCHIPKLKFDLEKQLMNISIISAFRKKYMCFYITLIETIHQKIVKIQEEYKSNREYSEKLHEYIKKFGYYCIIFVRSEWVDIKKPNPYRWETFFTLFRLPIKIGDLELKTIHFHGSTFEILARYKFYIIVKNSARYLVTRLKAMGYQIFKDKSDDNFISMGLDQEIYIPSPSIEHFYFVSKYICYFQLFLLFFHSFDYIKENNPHANFTNKEKMLFNLFFPVINGLFHVSKHCISKILVFKYYTFNSDELEVIYNNTLVENIKNIETKMMRYFLIKYSTCKKFDEYSRFPFDSHK